MRLFVAIELLGTAIKALQDAQEALLRVAAHARPTQAQHMHLTLAFLGEVAPTRLASIKAALDGVNFAPFSLALEKTGIFRRSGGDVVWAGLEKNAALAALQADVSRALRGIGVTLEERAFSPHITLAREVRLPPGVGASSVPLAKTGFDVAAFTLMQSERAAGAPVHTPLHAVSAAT